ncbi:unnamed protein product [Absidia cylindrospora]
MQLKLASVLFFVLALCAYTSSALPSAHPITANDDVVALNERDVETVNFADHLSGELAKRTNFPVNADAKLAAKIMVAVKAKVKADVVAKLSASVSEKIKASLDIKVKALGGIISVGDAKISAVQSAAIKKIQVKLDASIEASLQTQVYAKIEADLLKTLKKHKKCSQEELLKILIDLEAKLIATLKVKLPTICAKLKADIQASIDACIKDLQINIPLLLSVKISSSFKVDVAVKACVDLAIKICADLNAKVCAKAVLKAL